MRGVSVGSMRDQSMVVVESVDWAAQPGDYWIIAGIQGSGKSDFLLMAGGVMAPISGEYFLFGQRMPIFDESRLKHRLRMGLVFDGGQLFNHLTVAENIALPLLYHQSETANAASIQRILDRMELGPWADSTPGAIGRNWQKRVGLARALALKPELLLIDTPLNGLDLRHITWWLQFLDELSRGSDLNAGQPVTLVVTGADLRPWKGRANRFAILHDKKLTILGPWDQIESANQELLREVLAASPYHE
jgi:ABC-type transporter Mla maintaining outer membrane lipid asymmetry ATPase subunit MlaF